MKRNKIKLILVGESHVGKTSIITQYIKNDFLEEFITTTSQDKSIKEIKLENGEEIVLEIWDTIGQQKLRTTNKIFMKNAKIALIVYDITNENSFKNLKVFYNEINEYIGKENIVIGVVANKSDLYEEKVVSKEEGEEYAKSINALFFETSATDHQCIENLFKDIVNYYDEQKNPKIEEHLRDSFMLKNNKHVNNNIQDDKKNDDNNNDDNNNVNINNSIHKEDSNNGKKKCC
jgi:small GTP-binding protein